MPAIMLAGFGTTFQRIIHQEMRNTQSSWINGPGSTLIRSETALGTTIQLTFTGSGLFYNGTTFGGSVTGIEIVEFDRTPGFPITTTTLADITGLTIPDMADLVATAGKVAVGEPDFSLSDVVEFYDLLTPNTIVGSAQKDFAENGPGMFTMNLGKGNDVALIGPGSGTVNMGKGKKDAVDFRNATDSLDLDIGTGEARFGADLVTVSGGKFFFGTELDDTLTGSTDTDTIFGRGGDDTITGLGSRDILRGDAGDDIIRGGGGNDKLYGQADNDRVVGNAGDDMLFGGNGKDRLIGGGGSDTMEGGKGRDTLRGGDMRDFIYGGDDRDFIFGNKGDDLLEGNGGNDVLTGGPGRDTFSIDTDDFDAGIDTVTDFVKGTDQILLFTQDPGSATIVAGTGGLFTVLHAYGEINVTMATPGTVLTTDDIFY